MLGKFTSEYIG